MHAALLVEVRLKLGQLLVPVGFNSGKGRQHGRAKDMSSDCLVIVHQGTATTNFARPGMGYMRQGGSIASTVMMGYTQHELQCVCQVKADAELLLRLLGPFDSCRQLSADGSMATLPAAGSSVHTANPV